MSPHAFREKARSFLNLAQDTAEIEKRNAELAQLKEENAKIKADTDAKLAQMQEQMSALLAAVAPKKTRKPKVNAEA
jgi:cell shape-determining protein MreC